MGNILLPLMLRTQGVAHCPSLHLEKASGLWRRWGLASIQISRSEITETVRALMENTLASRRQEVIGDAPMMRDGWRSLICCRTWPGHSTDLSPEIPSSDCSNGGVALISAMLFGLFYTLNIRQSSATPSNLLRGHHGGGCSWTMVKGPKLKNWKDQWGGLAAPGTVTWKKRRGVTGALTTCIDVLQLWSLWMPLHVLLFIFHLLCSSLNMWYNCFFYSVMW